jgi:predicted Zn-dependent protease
MDTKNRLLSIILLLLLYSCAVNPVTGKQELMFVSERQEIEIGRETAPSLNWEFGGEFHDPELKEYLERIVRDIWRDSERPHLPFRFAIQNTSVPNAFALPGYVAITRGLLAELENEAQFAAVMGHEVGHVMARHTAKRITLGTLQQIGLVAGGLALGEREGSDILMRLGALGSSLLLLKYDRDQEIQADLLGVRYMAYHGYDPYEAVRAHERLEEAVKGYLKRQGKKPSEDTLISAIFSTHPRESVRKSEIRNMIKELPPYPLKGDGRFKERFQKRVKGLREVNRAYFQYDRAMLLYNKGRLSEAENSIRKAIDMNPEQAPFYNLYGMIRLKEGDHEGATNYFRKALSRDRDYQPSIYGLGLVAMKRKEFIPAIEKFTKSLELYPGHPGSNFGIGKSYYSIAVYHDAIPYLRKFSAQAPKHPEVHGLLGICYEKTGNLRAAVREYQLQLRVAPDTELGRHARERLILLQLLIRPPVKPR